MRIDIKATGRINAVKIDAKCLLLVHEDQHEPFAVVKNAAMSRRSKNRTFPRRARRAIRTTLLVWEMHSPLNVSRQPFRKRYKSRRAAPSAIFSRRVSRRRRGRWYRRHCSGIKYPIESLIRQQTCPILGHLFAPTAMFALGAETRSWTDIFLSCASIIYTEFVNCKNISEIVSPIRQTIAG